MGNSERIKAGLFFIYGNYGEELKKLDAERHRALFHAEPGKTLFRIFMKNYSELRRRLSELMEDTEEPGPTLKRAVALQKLRDLFMIESELSHDFKEIAERLSTMDALTLGSTMVGEPRQPEGAMADVIDAVEVEL